MGQRIVLTSFGSLGDLYPYLGLAGELRRRGHHPVLATSAFYRQRVEEAGFGFCPVRPDITPDDGTLIRRVMDPRRGPEVLVREVLLPHLRDSYADLSAAARGAAMLVTHPITFAGPLVAEEQKMPWVSTVLAPMSFFSAYDLPVFPPLPWLIHLRRLGPGVSQGLIRLARWVTRRWMEPVHQLRADLGLPAVSDPLYAGQYSPGLTLALFSRLLAAPQPDWPPHARSTGFVFYDEPDPLPPEVEQFLADGPAPLVFTLGSSAVGAAGDFYQESLDAVRRLGCRAVLLVGVDPQNRSPEPLPEGVLAVEYASHGALFPHAAAIIHHGGMGTTGQALRAGRPMLIVPYAFDQPDNAFRVTHLGVARTLARRHYTAAQVAIQLRALLEEPHYAERAAEVGRIVQSEDGAQQACDALEAYLSVAPQAAPRI